MRTHTALHALSGVVFRDFGAKVTGGNMEPGVARMDFELDGISVEFIRYPDPLVRKFSFSETPLKVYEGETELKVRLKADKSTSPGKHNLSAKLRVQACDDRLCYAPGALDVTVPVNVK